MERHARRKFFEAKETAPQPAHEALARISQLYVLERQAQEAQLVPDSDSIAAAAEVLRAVQNGGVDGGIQLFASPPPISKTAISFAIPTLQTSLVDKSVG